MLVIGYRMKNLCSNSTMYRKYREARWTNKSQASNKTLGNRFKTDGPRS